ncbi:MAG: type IV pilin protein [Steroidobacteraceae bacterium]
MTHSHKSTATLVPENVRAAGFTLIELMITVVIAAVLMSIAFPLYQHQIRESRRTDARSALLDLASREERYYATNNVYTSSASDVGYGGWGSGYPIGGGYYYLVQPTITAATSTTPAGFTLVAQPIAGKGQDADSDCQSFTVLQTGQDTSTNSASGDSSPTCWK